MAYQQKSAAADQIGVLKIDMYLTGENATLWAAKMPLHTEHATNPRGTLTRVQLHSWICGNDLLIICALAAHQPQQITLCEEIALFVIEIDCQFSMRQVQTQESL